ncbi:MAG TPA: hypothetical protein VGH15_05665 [Caulobacteraceae bacterium]|jgi:hypothetical protein
MTANGVRNNRREVKNPILALEAMKRVNTLSPESRSAIRALCHDISVDANKRAHACWIKNKGPMAAYWMAVRAISGNIRRAINP